MNCQAHGLEAARAVLGQIADRRRLGLHAGVVGDGLVDLVEAGVLDNSAKTEHRGKSVVGALVGTSRLYGFAHENQGLLVEPVTVTHDRARLAALPRLTSEYDVLYYEGVIYGPGGNLGHFQQAEDFARQALDVAPDFRVNIRYGQPGFTNGMFSHLVQGPYHRMTPDYADRVPCSMADTAGRGIPRCWATNS
jgi:hypothetical protein